ncbi:MAG: transposase [Planctomycetota bacterium]
MERQLWEEIVAVVKLACNGRVKVSRGYSSFEIAKVWFWAVLHDRPVTWACRRCNWPANSWGESIPSDATMSRRLHSPGVQKLLTRVEELVLKSERGLEVCWLMDGKPLPIGGCTKDKQAGFGRAAGCNAKGYKLHVIMGKQGKLAEWRVAPMNKDERVMAARMLKATTARGYFVADSNYDSNKLHQVCDDRGNMQLVVGRRYGAGRGFGHRKQTAGRLRSVELTENPSPEFSSDLFKYREQVERYFGNLTSWGGGLSQLPAWVRTHRRVKRWLQAKLIVNAIKRISPYD